MIVLARVDDRLIHGLVAVAWTSHLAPETILVANDAVANDEMKKNIMKLAKPAGVKLFIKTRDAAAKALNNPINDGKRIFLVTETVEDAAYVHGLLVHPFDTLNFGTAGIKKRPGEEYITTIPQVYMTKRDFEFAEQLHGAGVEVFCQANPTLERLEYSGIEKLF